ncbi:MAG: PAS domain-containing protein [Burkholderiales bacterium]|nr:PAS domain-containing protein [Anaerolineae bacterium]
MAQDRDEQIMLREVLHVIASNPNLERCVTLVLDHARTVTGADGAAFWLFDDPEMAVAVGDGGAVQSEDGALAKLAATLGEGVYHNPPLPAEVTAPYEGWLVATVRVHGNAAGMLWLSFATVAQLSDNQNALLSVLVDALTIIAANAQTQERHASAHHLAMSLLNSITDPLLALDDDLRVLMMNPAAETVFGMTFADALGRPVREVVRADDLAALAEGAVNTLEEWTTEDDKTFVPRRETVYDADGQPDGWVLALRDVTRFKKLNRNQSEFTRIVSHDLRSPLTSMQGFASMLESGMVGDLNEKQGHFVEKILAGITQITALVDNIQDAGRYDPETGFYEMSRSACDLGEIISKIVQNHLVPAEKGELTISTSIADDVPIINADGNMLERAIINLVDNAIKYTPNGGNIKVSVFRRDEELLVSVADTGLGIRPEDHKHLFDRHMRVIRKEHKKVKGSGLGLFIVRSVAQRHGGDAWVESGEGEGSTFFVSIPLAGPNLLSWRE